MKLKENPFHILGIGPDASRNEIRERAQALDLDEGGTQGSKARRILTTAPLRTQAEAAWMWGAETNEVEEMVRLMRERPEEVKRWQRVTPLGRLNLYAAALEDGGANLGAIRTRELIEKMDLCSRVIDARAIRERVNTSRENAGITPVQDEEPIKKAVKEQIVEGVGAARKALDALRSTTLVETVTSLVSEATEKGERRSGPVIRQLVEIYEVEAQTFLGEEGVRLGELKAEALRMAMAGKGEQLEQTVGRLLDVLRNWDRIAQPIQMNMRSRGQRHERSYETAGEVHDLAITLWNQFDIMDPARDICQVMKEVFAEEAEVAERIEEDIRAMGPTRKKKGGMVSSGARHNHGGTGWKGLAEMTTPRVATRQGRERADWRNVLNDTGRADGGSEQEGSREGQRSQRAGRQGHGGEQKTGGRWWWALAVLILIVIGALARDSGRKGSQEGIRTTATAPTPTQIQPSVTETRTPEAMRFSKPRAGQGLTLNIAEIRWCVRESIRIEALRPRATDNYRVDRFNALIADYNSRCASYRYRRGMLRQAQEEVRRDASQIRANVVPPW